MANNTSSASFEIPSERPGAGRGAHGSDGTPGRRHGRQRPAAGRALWREGQAIAERLREERPDYGDLGFDWAVEPTGPSLIFSHNETIDMESAVMVAQIMLDLEDDSATYAATWADTCSRARIGEFGGGAVAFNRHRAIWRDAHSAARELVAQLDAPAAAEPVYLTPADRMLLRSALDSHTYWQLSDDHYRGDGFVHEPRQRRRGQRRRDHAV